jgi:molybdate transport system ATP-binding protein
LSATAASLHVRLSHRVHAGLTIEVEFRLGNECGVLFGPSGSGKSTILRLIAGLVRPREGFVRLEDEVLSDSSRKINKPLRHRRVGLIFQDDLLFPHLSVARNVRFGLGRWSRTEADARLAEVAALCGIEARHALIERIRRIQRVESIPALYVTHAPDEAIALGTRLFLLEAGRIVAEGDPLDLLSARGPRESLRLRNVFEAKVDGHEPDGLSTVLRIVDGPALVVPKVEAPSGSALSVEVGADDVVLSRGPIGLLSARNLIVGTVERIVPHGLEVQVIVRTGGVSWSVGLIPSAIEALGLIEGEEVRMIIKARSCRVLRDP